MKQVFVLLQFFLLTTVFISCKKSPAPTPVEPPARNLVRIQQGVDPDLSKDTIKLISYESSGRIRYVSDSIYRDTLFAYYDASGRLSRIVEQTGIRNGVSLNEKGDSVLLTYNADNTLAAYNFSSSSYKFRYEFEYNAGTLSKSFYYTENVKGFPLQLWRTFSYVVSGGNIINRKEYSTSNKLEEEINYTYDQQDNPFRQIALFNFANRLGTEEVIYPDVYFNKNIVSGYTGNLRSVTNANTFNASAKPSKIVSRYQYPGGSKFNYVFTRLFSYD